MRTVAGKRVAVGLFWSTRPRQWVKNILVLAAPLAAGVLADVIPEVVAAFGLFVLVSASVYLFNDTMDAAEDRNHPTKKSRPIAAGLVPIPVATGTAVALLAIGLSLGFVVDRDLGVVLALYALLQVAYALLLKHQAVIDLAVVASGFLLRAIAGGVAADVPLSQWFLLVAAFGSLFMVAGKRYSELRSLGTDAGTRRTLNSYSESYLRFVWSLAAAVTITAYSLWAFEISEASSTQWQAISIAPFVLGLLRYAVDIDRGLAGEPEEAVLRDHVLQGIGLIWIVVFALGVYRG